MSLELLYKGLFIAVFSTVFTFNLTAEGSILSWWDKLIQRLPAWLEKPLGGCSYCMAGQIALWYYFFLEDYSFVNHIFFITATIFITHLTMFIYDRTE